MRVHIEVYIGGIELSFLGGGSLVYIQFGGGICQVHYHVPPAIELYTNCICCSRVIRS